jgi:SAM-dependent methyltransferase
VSTAVDYFDGLNAKLLAAIPGDAGPVIEFGCANGRLGAACKQTHPGLRWTGVDRNPAALAEAAKRLDTVVLMDLDAPDLAQLSRGYDVVVFGNLLEHLHNPACFLELVHELSAPDARLVCCVPNMAHLSVIERMLAGDLTYDAAGLLDATHVRFLSAASTFKLLLDAGWLPNVRDRYVVGHANKSFVASLIAAARELGIPERTALTNIASHQLIIDCIKSPPRVAARADADFSVVVPVTDRQQLDLNVLRSPGLSEVHAAIIPVEGARNPAEALDVGRAQTQARWIVFCHQDVYFPRGSGRALAALFGSIRAEQASQSLIGFAGIAEFGCGRPGPAGLVIDRATRFDHPETTAAVSIDELAIGLCADSVHRIDPMLGWHLWGTDLCLAARRERGGEARIVRVPLFHNSYNDGHLRSAFHSSAQRLAAKYPGSVIPTLCGVIEPATAVGT